MGRNILNKLWRRAGSRVFAAILAVNLPLMAVLYVVVTVLIARNMTAAFENRIRSHARLVAISVEQQSDTTAIAGQLEDLTLSGELAYAAYVGAGDVRIAESVGIVPHGYVFREDFGYGEHADGIYGISLPLTGGPAGQGARLRLAYDETPVGEEVSRIYQWGLIAGGIYIVVLIPVSLLATSRLTSPLRRLGDTARHVAGGDMDVPVAVHFGVSELDALVDDIEYMRMQLKSRGDEIAGREARHRAVLENTAEGILTLDARGYIESINEAAQSIFGYHADTVLGTPFTRFLTAADADRCVGPDGRPHTGTGQSFKAVRNNGESLPILLSVSTFSLGDEVLYSVVVQDISERVIFEEKLARLAYYDPLTGLPNRRLFHDRLAQALARAERHDKLVGILFLDLDRFKNINDTMGHLFGDLLIQAAARRLLEVVRRDDTVARMGGDEFTVILTDISHIDGATQIAQKIIDQFAIPFQLGEHETFISTSIGITLYPFDDSDIEDLIKNADTAMYQAKASGRNTYELYSARAHAKASEKLVLETALRKAIQQETLEVDYQPQVLVQYQPQIDRFSGSVVGAEALLRWHHPELGLIYPDRFIPLAEETGLIIPIGEWVLRAACMQHLAWREAGLPAVRVSVNLSARQLRDPGIVEQLSRVVDETGIDPAFLELELTEQVIPHNIEEVAARLREFKAMGILISIDDFGTGHSSLSNIRMLPIDEVKIDKSFIHNVTHDSQNAAIAEAIIDMAHKLNLRVVAEGVELEEQLIYLHDRQCDLMQGYYFSRPLPAADFEILLSSEIDARNPLYAPWQLK